MTLPARTLFVFGCYLAVIGVVLLLSPNTLLVPFGLVPTSEVYVRILGMLALFLATYYVLAARANLVPLIRWSVVLRSLPILFFSAFVLAGLAPPALIAFGVVDLAAAGWTWWALRRAPSPRTTGS